MNTRIIISAILSVLTITLILCSLRSLASEKTISKSVSLLDLALVPPLIGNIIIITSSNYVFSLIGYYIYFIGMDLVVMTLVKFTEQYCSGVGKTHKTPLVMYLIPVIDAVQILFNPFFGHLFELEKISTHGSTYYRLVPLVGLMIHRVADYFVFFCVLVIFIIATVKSARLYREKYSVVLTSMLIVSVWETFYIFSRTPIDRSMIGFGVFGIIVYYFAIHYRPLRLLDRMLSDIASDMTDALYVYDSMGHCIWANEKGLSFLGLNNNETDRVSEKLIAKFGEREYRARNRVENIVVGSGDTAEYYTIENHAIDDDGKSLAGSYLTLRDTTEVQRRIKREIYNSTHDAQTDFFTKQHLFERIKTVLNSDNDIPYTVLYVDIKNFKVVNDIFSSEFGDKALKKIAEWIRSICSDKCLYGRIAGDAFGIIMPSEEFEDNKEKISKEAADFVASDGSVNHRILIHIGVYVVRSYSTDVSVMFDRAHLALSSINDNYREHIAYYDQKLRDRIFWDQQITAELNDAIKTRQIRPYLQPIMDRSNNVVGAEALARWIHPELGFMPPGKFIPVFEKNCLIIEVDRHIWRCSCEILSKWKNDHPDVFLSINISPKDFYFIDIVAEIKGLVKEYDIEPRNLRIEITETVMISDIKEGLRMLQELRDAGFIVEMDDFGSGYSSLNMLKDMPVDVLKIDMKFLADSDNSTKAQTIIRNIIHLSEDLNIVSLTEGVETQQQYSQLADIGCKLFQGYYFAKPMPLEEFEKFAFSKAV